MTSSRQSADEGKRLVRRGRTSDLTLSGTCASKDTLGEAHGVASRYVDQAPTPLCRQASEFYHSPMAATRSDGLGVF
jgi:hypothetical protein